MRHERGNPPPEMVPSPPRRVIARRVFSEQDVAIMLQCELRFRGDVNMAMRMRELLPNKTLKQFRDKRREATYVRRRDLLYAQREEELQGAAAEPPQPRELAVVLERIALADPPQPPPLEQVAEPVPIVLPEIAVEEVADFSRTEEFLRWKLDLLVGVQAINVNGRIGRRRQALRPRIPFGHSGDACLGQQILWERSRSTWSTTLTSWLSTSSSADPRTPTQVHIRGGSILGGREVGSVLSAISTRGPRGCMPKIQVSSPRWCGRE